MIRPFDTRDLDTIAMIESRLFQRPLGRGDLEQLKARPASRGFVFEDTGARVTSYASKPPAAAAMATRRRARRPG